MTTKEIALSGAVAFRWRMTEADHWSMPRDMVLLSSVPPNDGREIQYLGPIAAPDTDTALLASHLHSACVDWDGKPMADDEEPRVILSCRVIRGAADRLTALERELGEAQSMVQAWDHVFGTIEAHIMDRVNMGDPANPELYLQIIHGDIANIKRASDQICAARWAEHNRHAEQFTASKAEVERLKEALKPFARIADMEERAEPESSVIVNVSRCRDARAALQPQVGK